MHLVNKKYIKLDSKFDIYIELANTKGKNDNFFQKLLNITFYNKNNDYNSGIYISINDLIDPNIFDIYNLEIKRETICNSSLIALYNNDLETAQNLSFFFAKSSYTIEELGDLADYVLENSMSITEYLYGDSAKYIYKENKNCIELDYIFEDNKSEHKERKRNQKQTQTQG